MQANSCKDTGTTTIADQLTRAERLALARLEGIIGAGLKSFREVGEALEQIHSKRLYRQTHSAFEDYCQEKWGFTKRRAHQLIDAWKVGTIVPIENEAQARALSGLDPEKQKEVFEQATAGGKTPTAKALSDILASIDEAEACNEPPVEPKPQKDVGPAELDARCESYAKILAKVAARIDMDTSKLTRAQIAWLRNNPFVTVDSMAAAA